MSPLARLIRDNRPVEALAWMREHPNVDIYPEMAQAVQNERWGLLECLATYGQVPLGTLTPRTSGVFPVGDTLLHRAVDDAKPNMLQHLLGLIDPPFNVNAQTEHGTTALHLAVQRQDLRSIQRLGKAGALADVLDNEGRSPLSLLIGATRLYDQRSAPLVVHLCAQSAQRWSQAPWSSHALDVLLPALNDSFFTDLFVQTLAINGAWEACLNTDPDRSHRMLLSSSLAKQTAIEQGHRSFQAKVLQAMAPCKAMSIEVQRPRL